ncbi:MAG: translation initiation factor IF-2 [Bacteroidales bacterium]|nr:translation initiation factor IF-2 [Bacteroidales bacterium]
MGQDNKDIRINKIARELNVGVNTIVDFLKKKGFDIDNNPNTKIDATQHSLLIKEFSSDIQAKKQMERQAEEEKKRKEAISAENEQKKAANKQQKANTNNTPNDKKEVKVIGKIDLDQNNKSKNNNQQNENSGKNNSGNSNNQNYQNNNQKNQNVQNNQNPKKEGQNNNQQQKSEHKEQRFDNQKKQNQQNQQKNNNNNNNDKNVKVVGKLDLDSLNQKTRPNKKDRRDDRQNQDNRNQQNDKNNQNANNSVSTNSASSSLNEEQIFAPSYTKITGPTVLGKIELPDEHKPTSKSSKKKKRRRIGKELVDIQNKESQPKNEGRNKGNKKGNKQNNNNDGEEKNNNNNNERRNKNKNKDFKRNKQEIKKDVTEEDVNKQVKETLARLTNSKGKSKTSKHRREKRDEVRSKEAERLNNEEKEKQILKVTEFVSANELASLMNVHVNQLIMTCFDLGTTISINQRLDAEIISILASEYGFEAKFISADANEEEQEQDNPDDLESRPPIVTVMGHVDHGKTSLLDYIRKTNVIAGEAGGITQHIGAYNVTLPNGQHITFLDTPGHEAFTAMRARGAKITDIAVIVIAADDSIMPQTEEAINHAQAAGVPIIFAINKIDKPAANVDKIKEELANRNLLIEEWGGKYGSVDISAKKGMNVDKLLERILLEAEMLELKANYHKPATGSIIEASLDKGRGYIATVLVDSGTLKIGDVMWAGSHSGKIKAMFNERNKKITEAGPAEPALVLGLDGAPEAGDKFKIMPDERSAREKASQRQQIEREIGVRTHKRPTLDDIGRRIKLGDFKELNIVIKGDVQGSIEALQDSLEKLSTEQIEVKVIHKAVGQISESDVLLASASNAIIIGFQVRPSMSAKKLAEKEEIDIRLYSIIYSAIDDIKDAMAGMLSPEIKEEIVGTAEIMELFKISKVGTIAGCIVKDGKIVRKNKCRIIRDGIVVYTGELGSLKRFKDDASEVTKGMECGLNIEKFNDIKVGDIVESFEEKEVQKSL